MKKSLVMSVLVVLLPLLVAGAQGHADSNPADIPPAPAEEYPVTLDGKVLFTTNLGWGSLSLEERDWLLSDRLQKLASDPFFDVSRIEVSESEATADIVAGDRIIMSVTQRDAAALGRSR